MALTRVDDRSSSIIYSSGWGRGGAATDYNDSVTYAGTDGETATLTFQGIGISVFGHIMAASPGIPPPVTSYSIDGGTPTIYNQVQDDSEHPNQQFYQSPILSNTKHRIVITNIVNGAHAAFFLDYFLVVAGSTLPAPIVTTIVTPAATPVMTTAITSRPDSSSNNPSAISTMTSVSIPKMLSTMAINGTVYTVTVTPSSPGSSFGTSSTAMIAFSSGSSSSSLKGGIIVGSCIGAFAAILLLGVVVFLWLRKRRRDEYDWRNVSEFSSQPHSQWQEQARSTSFARTYPRFSTSPTSGADDHSSTHHDAPIAVRPPSYSHEPPAYDLAHTSLAQNPLPSKIGLISP